jgi:hypothetical protein
MKGVKMGADKRLDLNIDFIVAQYAPTIIMMLSQDESVRPILGDKVADLIKNYPKNEGHKNRESKEIREAERAVMLAFVRAAYPLEPIVDRDQKLIGYKQLNKTMLQFICKSYLEHRHNGAPIWAEDFYKIADNLRDFESFKNSGLLRGGEKSKKEKDSPSESDVKNGMAGEDIAGMESAKKNNIDGENNIGKRNAAGQGVNAGYVNEDSLRECDVSGSDVSGSDVSGSGVSGSGVSGSGVSGSGVSGNHVSGSSISSISSMSGGSIDEDDIGRRSVSENKVGEESAHEMRQSANDADENNRSKKNIDKKAPKKDLGDLSRYQNYQEFLEVITPLQDARDLKKAAEMRRKMTPEERSTINQETTILYDGAEGQVVIPHTPRAAQFWGANTKWCVAGAEYAHTHFPEYNKKSPIVMMIPKGRHDQKIALVDKKLWDATDKTIEALPELHANLFTAMLREMRPDVADDIRALIGERTFKICAEEAKLKKEREDACPPEWQEYLTHFNQDISFCLLFNHKKEHPLIPPALLADKKFMMLAVAREGNGLEFAADDLLHDRNLVLQAVRQNGMALQHAAPAMRADFEIVMAAIENTGHALFFAEEKLKQNRAVILAAVRSSAETYHYLDEAIKSDREIIFEVMKKEVHLLEYAPSVMRRDTIFLLQAAKENISALKYTKLEPYEIAAIKIKAFEELLAEGQIGKIKNILARHEKEAWGRVEAQFGHDDKKLSEKLIAKMKAEMNKDVRKAYDALVVLKGEVPIVQHEGFVQKIIACFKPKIAGS